MRLRGPLVTIGALGLAVLAVRLVAVWTSVGRAHSTSGTVLGTTIKVNSAVTFAAGAAVAFGDRRRCRAEACAGGVAGLGSDDPPGCVPQPGLAGWRGAVGLGAEDDEVAE